MKRFVTVTVVWMCVLFCNMHTLAIDADNVMNDPPGNFNLLEPANGTHFIFTKATDTLVLKWENVLGIENGDPYEDEYDEFYLLRPGLDPDLYMSFGDDIILEPFFEVTGSDIGFVFMFFEMLLQQPVDTVGIYWTVGAVNEFGETWANDTFFVSFSIDNDPPSSDFDLLEPPHNAIVEIVVSGDTFQPVDEKITFTWAPSSDPDDDTVYYYWVLSDTFPIPDFLNLFEDEEFNGEAPKVGISRDNFAVSSGLYKPVDNGNDEPIFIIFPSGDFEDDEYWDTGGTATYLMLPHYIGHYWLLGEEEEKEFYWTVVATDGFGIYHWTPSKDTLTVTLKRTFTNVIERESDIPVAYFLGQNYPNPFNPSTSIQYGVSRDTHVEIRVYNLLGQKVMEVVNEYQRAGTYTVTLDASKLSSGIYMYTMRAGEFMEIRRMIHIK